MEGQLGIFVNRMIGEGRMSTETRRESPRDERSTTSDGTATHASFEGTPQSASRVPVDSRAWYRSICSQCGDTARQTLEALLRAHDQGLRSVLGTDEMGHTVHSPLGSLTIMDLQKEAQVAAANQRLNELQRKYGKPCNPERRVFVAFTHKWTDLDGKRQVSYLYKIGEAL